MELPPGLLPDLNEPPRRSRLAPLVALALLVALVAAALQISRLVGERDAARLRADALDARLREAPPPPPPPVAPDPPPPPPPDPAPELLAQGLHEFRAGRYGEAERRFFRALPRSYVYLALCGLAQGNHAEAFGFLCRAIVLDPDWLRRVDPRDLFATPQAYAAVAEALESRLAADPLDVGAKLLLAYLRFHDQGAPSAKALVVEAAEAEPDLEEARRFLETLER